MKKAVIILFFLLNQSLVGQEKNVLSNTQVSIDFGSMRNRYFYPITNLQFHSPLLQKVNLKFSIRLRSLGSLYLYSKGAYDITPMAEYYFTKTIKPIYFSVGIGIDARLRMINDKRSAAASSAEPLMSLTFHGNYKKMFFKIPLWTRFYSNGISANVLPEAYFKIGKTFSIFVRHELSYISIYHFSTHEWRNDSFVGTHIYF